MDIDCICLKSLDLLIKPRDKFISGLEYGPNDLPDTVGIIDLSLFTNWVVIAEAGHPILKEMIEDGTLMNHGIQLRDSKACSLN